MRDLGARWREHLPGFLILGSPVVASAMTLCVALTDIYLLPAMDLVEFGAETIVPINGLLAALAAAAGGLRVGGTVPRRIAVTIAAFGFAGALYAVVLTAAVLLLPGL